MAFKVERDATLVADARRQMGAAIGEFKERCRSAGVDYSSSIAADDLCAELARAGQRHDVLLLGRSASSDGAPTDDESQLLNILRSYPGPAIVAPAVPSPSAGRVVVAYDGSVQAARTLRSFTASGFCANTPVQVLSFDRDEAAAKDVAAIAEEFLQRHGRQVKTECRAPQSGESVADAILAACQTHNARLLVMGAYGKSSIRDFVLGSTTKSVLSKARQPVFVDQ